LPQDDPTQRKPDITLARTKLGWEPKVALRDGLVKTIESMKKLNFEDYRPPTPNY
jgi:UDP-glucuronate decarboxylase